MPAVTWWKEFALEPNRWARWRIGPLELFVRASSNEWVIAWHAKRDPLDGSLTIHAPSDEPPDAETFTFSRYAIASESTTLRLMPRQPDRAFVVRPELPLFLPAREHVRLYVSTPVWVTVTPVDGDCPDMFETPSFRASDTWFGRGTLEGELCYASKTYARMDLSAMGLRPHRAITPVEITNKGTDTLLIEQLRVPLPALSLFEGEDGRLWTDVVSLVREEDETSAAMTVTPDHRVERSRHTLIRDPRKPIEPGTIIDVFSQLLA